MYKMRTFLTLQNLDQIPTLHSLNKQHPGDTSRRPEKEFKYVFLNACMWNVDGSSEKNKMNI